MPRYARSRALLGTGVLAVASLMLLGLLPPGAAAPRAAAEPSAGATDLTAARAHWIDTATVVWPVAAEPGDVHRLVHDPAGRIRVNGDGTLNRHAHRDIRLSPTELTDAQRAAHPHLAALPAFALHPRDATRAAEVLRGQVVAVRQSADGEVTDATGVQIPGVLDDRYAEAATEARLGPVFDSRGRPALSVWAPTARGVALELDGRTVPMRRDPGSGVWSVTGHRDWYGKPYRYRVTVWSPDAGEIVTNRVTDPYSTALTADSERSLLIDLDDPALAPAGWQDPAKPEPVPLTRATVQELHVRDFSVADPTARHPGQYLAFTDPDSDGMRHLRTLAAAGTTHVHLLPTFDIATIPERRRDQAQPDCDPAALPADSPEQQECIGRVRARDAYNWGYDPLHFTVPEGSYASDPDGPQRTLEYRRMVQGLNGAGLGVVLDVVYNHTPAAGQDEHSVLDRIVPGYYHRLLDDGSVATSTCCANTAPEHAMMGKLVVDSVVTWATQYKVDGFRFDLMGHHPRQNMLDVRAALDELTEAEDGIDGKDIILYGEGWNFGEIADDARFVQATQEHMAGTGIATFSDRARDAVRGGGPFDEDPRVQGFATGLFTDPNASPANGTAAEQRARLLHHQDLVKIGLAGSLADYTFTDSSGRTVRGSDVDYNGAPAGYADRPGDALAYVDAHDNETLYDALAYKLPLAASPSDRARAQVLAQATALFSQGPVLGQAGTHLLRSKSLDRNSYDSGDWYNAIRWDCGAGNGFAAGLPPAWDNEHYWPYAGPALAAPGTRVGCTDIRAAAGAYLDLLTIRSQEEVFALPTAEAVQREVSFPLSGPEETPGVILMTVGDLVVVFNATPERQSPGAESLAGGDWALHPVQAGGTDPTVRSAAYSAAEGVFETPARTVAVFTRS